MSLAAWVILGAVSGAFCGVFFGEAASVVEPLGSIYVALLQMAVFPFIVSSLLHGLGSMRPAMAAKLFRSGWPLFVVAWGGTLIAVWLLTLAIPEGRSALVITAEQGGGFAKLVSLLIPANPFADFYENYVPAIVVFSVFFGIAIQSIEKKQSVLNVFEVIKLASVKIWGWVVRLAPIGVFALFADLGGTVRFSVLGSLLLYALLFVCGSLILAFWVIPSIIACLVPVGYRELLKELGSAIVIAVTTSLPVSAVPFIIEFTKRLADRCQVEDPERDDIVSTTMAVGYPIAQLGNLFVFLFMVFAAYFFQAHIQVWEWFSLPLLTLLSTVGTPVSTVDAVSFIASWLGLPSDAQLLYVEMMTLTRYPQVLVSTLGLAFITILIPLSYYGILKIQARKLAVSIVISVLLLGGVALGGKVAQSFLIEKHPDPYRNFTIDADLSRAVNVTVSRAASSSVSVPDRSLSTMERIRKTDSLRVGYGPHVIPFSYFNAANELVGYDVALAYALARDLNVDLELIPISDWESVNDELEAGRYDLAIGGVYVTDERLKTVTVSKPYLQSPLALIVPSQSANAFLNGTRLKQKEGLKIATFKSNIMIPQARALFPRAEVVVVDDYDVLLRDESIDAAIWTLEQARAWAAANPGFSAVVPNHFGAPLSMAYLMPPNSPEFVIFVNEWLDLQRTNGFEQRMKEYWLLGKPRLDDRPRWSIIRNVLHWVD